MSNGTAVAVEPLPGSPEWLLARRNGLGASEVPAILGLDKYKSGLDIWLEKRGMAEPRPGDTIQQTVGRFAERMIAEMYAEQTGAVLVTVPTFRHPQLDTLFASADRMVVGMDATDWLMPVEIKNRGGIPQGWGDAGTDLIPEAVAVQVHVQMACYNFARADVAALLGGNDFRIYTLHRNKDIEAYLLEQAATWWQRHIVEGIEPDIAGPNAGDYLARKFRSHTEVVTKADEPTALILGALATARAELKEIESEKERLELLVKAAIGENKGIEAPAGKALWSLTKDSQVIAWEGVARNLATTLGDAGADILQRQVEAHTTVKPGIRRFTFTPKKEA
jgi:putative phage-type endonuclease